MAHDHNGNDTHWFTRKLATEAGLELTPADLVQCAEFREFWNGGFADLEAAVREATISQSAAAFMAITLWRNKPDSVSVDYPLWAGMFRTAGFTEDRHRATHPTRPALLFRGAIPERARGLSWTTDLEQARYFATSDRQPNPERARVWMAWVPPETMLAKFGHHEQQGESEVLVDATHLNTIVDLPPARVDQLLTVHGCRFAGGRRKYLRWAIQARRLRRECAAAAR